MDSRNLLLQGREGPDLETKLLPKMETPPREIVGNVHLTFLSPSSSIAGFAMSIDTPSKVLAGHEPQHPLQLIHGLKEMRCYRVLLTGKAKNPWPQGKPLNDKTTPKHLLRLFIASKVFFF